MGFIMEDKYSLEKMQEAVLNSKSYSDVMRWFNLPTTGGNHRMITCKIRYFGISVEHFERKKINLDAIDDGLLQEKVGMSYSYSQLCKELKLKYGTHIVNSLRAELSKRNISDAHFTGASWNKGKTKFDDKRILVAAKKRTTDASAVFIENSKTDSKSIRIRIISEGILEYKCSWCGIKEWNGGDITLHLDHINGISNDNRIENLRFLCPNCHQQTPTWGRKKLN